MLSFPNKILEIITLRNERLRGQAWVIYDHVSSATAALQAEQGFTFFGKDLKLAYAREKSDRVSKLDGTFVPKDRREKREREQQDLQAKKLKVVEQDGDAGTTTTTVQDPSSSITTEGKGDAASVPSTETPSNILFADSLPKDCNELMLSCLFRSYAGYKEVRTPRPGLAFIEFEEEPQASVALKALDGFSLSPTDKLNLKYGKS